MKICKWIATAEVNMNASHYETIIIEANTKKKALRFAERYFKNMGFFHIENLIVKPLE